MVVSCVFALALQGSLSGESRRIDASGTLRELRRLISSGDVAGADELLRGSVGYEGLQTELSRTMKLHTGHALLK